MLSWSKEYLRNGVHVAHALCKVPAEVLGNLGHLALSVIGVPLTQPAHGLIF
jgi:hypothetical protein